MRTVQPLHYVDGNYITPDKSPPWPGRLIPNVSFYLRTALITVRSAWRASRGRYGDREWSDSSLEVLRALECSGVRMFIEGTHHFKTLPEPCIILGNHMSTLETLVLPGIISPFRRVAFVVKQSLVNYPVFSHVMRSRNPITVGRMNPREDLRAVLEGGGSRLAAGISVVIFPQTTRTSVFDPSQFNSIGIKLARTAQVPVIPLAIKSDAWGIGKICREFGRIDPSRHVHFEFGPPIRVSGRGAEEHKAVVDFIIGRLRAWGGEIASDAR